MLLVICLTGWLIALNYIHLALHVSVSPSLGGRKKKSSRVARTQDGNQCFDMQMMKKLKRLFLLKGDQSMSLRTF